MTYALQKHRFPSRPRIGLLTALIGGLNGCAFEAHSGPVDTDIGLEELPITGADRITDSARTPRFPAVVSVSASDGVCSGTVITPRHVLTAKHCGSGSSVSLEAAVGTATAPLDRYRYPVTRTYPHPTSDIAVLELGRTINRYAGAGDPSYGVVPLRVSSTFSADSVGVSVGYAETRGLLPSGACNYIYGTRRALRFVGRWTITETGIGQPTLHCADPGFRGNDPGDSGGPLLDSSNRVVGVFSGWGGGLAHWARINGAVAGWINQFATDRHLRDYGWLRTTNAAEPGPLDARYSFNSSGFTNSVVRTAFGKYQVVMPGLGGPGGSVQVAALGADNTRCKVEGWSGTVDQTIVVACHTPSGAPAYSRFVVSFERRSERGAYLLADQPTNPLYAPSGGYSSAGGSPTVQRLALGVYRARLPGVASAATEGGNVLVTAHGTDASYCKVVSWARASTDVLVQVGCFDASGAAVDASFALSYTDSAVPSPYGWGAYAWANDPASVRYDTPWFYTFTSSEGLSGITDAQARPYGGREVDASNNPRTGQYWLRYPYQVPFEGTAGSAVLTTAYGSGNAYCKLRDWRAPDVTAYTSCFDASGRLADSAYVNRLLFSATRLF